MNIDLTMVTATSVPNSDILLIMKLFFDFQPNAFCFLNFNLVAMSVANLELGKQRTLRKLFRILLSWREVPLKRRTKNPKRRYEHLEGSSLDNNLRINCRNLSGRA